MGAYILRRLLLVIPTLFGIMFINFFLTQFVPGGPVEQVIARLDGGGDAFSSISGGNDAGQQEGGGAGGEQSQYIGARGLPPDFIAQLEQQFGFARIVCAEGFTGTPSINAPECKKEMIPAWERFLTQMGNYLTFDFGESYFRSIGVLELVMEKMPVSITLGLWSTLIAYLVSIPLGIRKAVRDGSAFDSWTSGIIIAAYAIPGFLFAVLLLVLFAGGSYWQIFPLRGLLSDNVSAGACAPLDFLGWWFVIPRFSLNGGFDAGYCFGTVVPDYFWHITLPVIASTISSFATLTLLTKNSFLDEIKKQYVMTARAKGLTERRVLYGHVFRNAMLIVIAGFPALFVGVFFGGSIIIETVFSLDGLGRLGFEAAVSRDYPVIFGTLYFFGLLGLLMGILSDLMYVWVDPRIDFGRRG